MEITHLPTPEKGGPLIDANEWITLTEAARRWHLNPRGIRARLTRGTLSGRKPGRDWLVTVEEMIRVYGPEPAD